MNSLLKILFLLLTFGINLALAAESSNIQEIETLAEQGDAQAQFDLAQLYYEGTGIPSNYQLAVNFSRLAATQGLAAAQSFLGNLYRMGQGVPSDLVQAYVWYNLAAANGDTEATQVRILLEDELTDKQIADAQQISSECFSDGYQSCELTIEELIASRLQAQFQAQVEVQPEPQAQVEVQPEPQAQVEVQPESQVQVEVQPEPQAQVEVQPESQVQVEVQPEPQAQVEVQPESQVQSQTQAIPTSLFFERSAFDEVKISPDGNHLAITVPGDQDSQLIVLSLPNREPVASFVSERDQMIGDFYWVNEERIVFSTLVFQGGRNYPFLTGEIFALNIDNTKKYQLLSRIQGRFTGAFSISNLIVDDPNHIRVTRKQVRRRSVARSKPESLLLDIYSEFNRSISNLEDRVISPLPWGELYSDNAGTPRVAAAENEDSTFDVSYKDETDWVEIGGLLQVNNQPLKYFDFVGFNSTNDKFYFIGAGESGIRGLYQYDYQNEKRELIFQHPEFDIGYEDLVFSSDGTTILGAKVAGDVYQKFYFQEHPESDLHQSLDASFPGELVEVISTTRDGTIAIIRVSSPKRLGDIYLLDTTVPRLDILLTGSDLLLPEFMADVSPFTIEATDGLEIHGYVTKPQGMSSAVPMIVMPHGGPIGIRDVPLFNREAQFFAHHGFAVVQVNFRGSRGYGVPFEEAGYREWGLGIIDDITRATNWAIENGIAQQGKICIYGASFGGYAALTSVIKEPDLYRCAIGYAGLYDLTKLDRSDIPWQPGGDNYIEEAVGVNESELRAQSPVYNADKIEVPILLAHGGKDRRAPPFHARDMRKALRDNDKDVEWLYERGEAHGFYNTEININFYNQILAFLNKHLN